MKRDGFYKERWTEQPEPVASDATEHAHALKRLGAKLGSLVGPAINSLITGPPVNHTDMARERGELLDELYPKV